MHDIAKTISLKKISFEDIKDEDGKIIDCQPVYTEQKYTAILDIEVLERINDKYATDGQNGFGEWINKASEGQGSDQYKALVDILIMCINEGIRLENKHRLEVGLPVREKITEDDLTLDLSSILEIVTPLIKESTDTGIEKN